MSRINSPISTKQHKANQLSVYCNTFKSNWQSFSCQLGLIYSQISLAVANYAIYGPNRGVAILSQALDIALRNEIVLPFSVQTKSGEA